MANAIQFDFRHYYQRGDRRAADKVVYQWDLGHTAEIFVPVNSTYEIHYCLPGFVETEDYAVESISVASDGGYKLTAHIPNTMFEREGELKVYIVGTDEDCILTTYEGYITIRGRVKPEDYTDDDPDNGAQTILSQAHEYARQSEAWSKGTRDGEAVPSTADQYHNNSKYWSGLASGSATSAATSEDNAEAWAVGTKDGTAVTSDDPQYHNNSKYYKEQAAASEENAEAWAVGTKDGTAVPSTADQYHNNAKYWSDQAAEAAALVDAPKILGDFASYEATTTASKAYAVGDYLTYNGYLYRVTAAIASGGTITVGTNVVQTNVGDEIKNRRLWFKNVAVSAQSTAGTLIDLQDSRITRDYILEGNNIYWGNSSNITSEPEWSTDTAGHFIVTGTCSAATTATFALVKADSMTVNNVS